MTTIITIDKLNLYNSYGGDIDGFSRTNSKKNKEICDIESFATLTGKIKFYKNFQIIAEILQQIKSNINLGTDTVWAGFDSVDNFLKELNQDIENIKLCNFTTLDKVNIEFTVTSTYQELSMSNGWSDDYLKLAEKFDKVYEEIMTPNNY